jgi:hypothetical protein
MSSGDTYPQNEALVDASRIQERLRLILLYYPEPAAQELQQALQVELKTPSNAELIEATRYGLSAAAIDSAESQKSTVASITLSQFPEAFITEEGSLPTPRSYLKSANSGDDKPDRAKLKQAYYETIDSARDGLAKSLNTDYATVRVEPDINDQTIELALQEAETKLHNEVEAALGRIESAFQVQRFNLAARRTLSTLGINTKGPVLIARFTGGAQANVHRAMEYLTDLLYDLAESPDRIVGSAINQLQTTLDRNIYGQLVQAFESRARTVAFSLSQNIYAAYEQVQTSRQQHIGETALADTIPFFEVANTEQDKQSAEDGETMLGDIEINFPWNHGTEAIPVRVISENGQAIVYCEAMSEKAEALSNLLRKQPLNVKRLDLYIKRIILTELHDLDMQSDRIKMVSGVDRTIEPHNILRFGIRTPNAHRLYYSKTTVGNYPAILEAARAHEMKSGLEFGIDASTKLIILRAETDKQHQDDITLQEFGINPRVARAQGAGSV